MDLGVGVVKFLGTLVRALWKPLSRLGHALGLEWWLIIYFIPTRLGLANRSGWLLSLSLILCVTQIALNIYCKRTNQKNVNLLKFGIKFVVKKIYRIFKKDNVKGFEAEFNLDTKENISGMVFGKVKRKYVTKKEEIDGHSITIGGAGSGKSTGVAIPTLMSWKSRAFVIDIKGELYEKTKKARGEELIKVFNPSNENACGYNPFHVLKNTDDLCSSVKEIAQAIIPLKPEVTDTMWILNAQDFLTGAIIYFYNQDKNFSETMIAIKLNPPRDLVDEIMESEDQDAKIHMATFKGMADETLSGIYTEISNKILSFATNKSLIRALGDNKNVITPNDLENGFDVFIGIEEHLLEQWKPLVTMIVNQFCKFFERRKNDNDKPILFLLDEFPRLGRIDSVATGLTTLRSKKVEIMLYIQSKSQLDLIYGKDQAVNIIDNCTYKAILIATEPSTQKWCSELVGTYDKMKVSNSVNADNFGMGKGSGVTTTTEEKKIIKPEEFGYLIKENKLVYIDPTGYAKIDKIQYWNDKVFSNK